MTIREGRCFKTCPFSQKGENMTLDKTKVVLQIYQNLLKTDKQRFGNFRGIDEKLPYLKRAGSGYDLAQSLPESLGTMVTIFLITLR